MAIKSRQWFAVVLFAVVAACAPARADELADATAFLGDLNRIPAASAAVATDRVTLATDLSNGVTGTALVKDVKTFFKDRKTVALLETAAAADRKILRLDDGYKGPKFTKLVPVTGTIPDATQYLTDYAKWSAADTAVQMDVTDIQTAVTNLDTAGLKTALTAYFTDRHNRFQEVRNIVADIHTLKKDVHFKGAGKPVPPLGPTLSDLVQQFLNDRIIWVAQQAPLDSARSAIEAALSTTPVGDVKAAVKNFLTLRHGHFVEGEQLALDRYAMKLAVKLTGKEPPPTTPTSDIGPDTNTNLDQDDSTAGE